MVRNTTLFSDVERLFTVSGEPFFSYNEQRERDRERKLCHSREILSKSNKATPFLRHGNKKLSEFISCVFLLASVSRFAMGMMKALLQTSMVLSSN